MCNILWGMFTHIPGSLVVYIFYTDLTVLLLMSYIPVINIHSFIHSFIQHSRDPAKWI
jgi:hypothetical protein